ncbi:MAG: hypothetical protein F4X23_10510 [Gemmatimonadales bacterium]|nr:hypothetical protein [Gemmatimonadales bacterium]
MPRPSGEPAAPSSAESSPPFAAGRTRRRRTRCARRADSRRPRTRRDPPPALCSGGGRWRFPGPSRESPEPTGVSARPRARGRSFRPGARCGC